MFIINEATLHIWPILVAQASVGTVHVSLFRPVLIPGGTRWFVSKFNYIETNFAEVQN